VIPSPWVWIAFAGLLAAGCAPSTAQPGGGTRAGGEPSRALQADTTLALPGLTAPVRIVTDRSGIPHLQATNPGDLYHAWGFVTARDRLWQLLLTRQGGRGATWQWFGNRALQADGGAQLFELSERAERIWARDREDPVLREALERYAAGVNAWMDLCRSGAVAWPAEVRRLGIRPDPWRPVDSYLTLFGMGFLLDFDLPELREQTAIERDGLPAFRDRRRYESTHVYNTIPDDVAAGQWQRGVTEVRAPDSQESLLPAGDPDTRASNVFAVGARRSASGRPLLANDPHLPLGTPNALHVLHVSTTDGVINAAGAQVPGLPAIVSGRNGGCAWGITSLSADVMDVYADTLSKDRRQVRSNGGWAPIREGGFTMRYQVFGPLRVPPLGRKRRYTPHGPIVHIDERRRIAYSVRWAGDDARVTLRRLVGIEHSASAAELTERVRSIVSPGLNVVAIDRAHVRYQTVGALPRRTFVPAPGPLPSDGRHEWRGLVGPDSMPAWDVPPDSVVVNANNRPAGAGYFEPLPRFDWVHDRAWRIAERLHADPLLTLDDLRSVQNDVTSRTARRVVPLLIAHAESGGPLDPRHRAVLDTLRAWNFECRRRLVAPTLFRAWYGALVRRAKMDGLGGLPEAALDGRASELLRDPAGAPESPAAAVRGALDTALVRLAAQLGPDMRTWTWARAHRARFAHAMAASHPDLQPPTLPMDGDNVTPSVGRSRLPWDVEVTHGPVWRLLVDLADPSRAWCVLAPGNAAEGSHRTDLAERWVEHAYVPLDLDWSRVDAAREGEWRLTPGPR
jgi:penicillin amidase